MSRRGRDEHISQGQLFVFAWTVDQEDEGGRGPHSGFINRGLPRRKKDVKGGQTPREWNCSSMEGIETLKVQGMDPVEG